jgi:hypothetical protein
MTYKKLLGMRKYLLVWGAFIIATVLLHVGKVSDTIWWQFSICVIGLYFGANVGSKFSKKNKEG